MSRSSPPSRSSGRTPGTPATKALARARIEFTVHRYDHDPAVGSYGAEAAAALAVSADRIFKTLLVVTGPQTWAVGVVSVNSQLDLKAIAATLGVKRATMATPSDAERLTGYVVGGISPMGQKRRLPVVIDASAQALATVLVSGGQRGLDVELAPADLARITEGVWAPIAVRES